MCQKLNHLEKCDSTCFNYGLKTCNGACINKEKVSIIGVDVDKDINDAITFQKALKSDAKLNFEVINDPQNLIISEFNPIGMPTLYYLKHKKIVSILTGAIDNIDEQILADLKKMELE